MSFFRSRFPQPRTLGQPERFDNLLGKLGASGNVKAAYNIQDLSTLDQVSTGGTPVTTPGQRVGLVRDQSGNGNDATQPTSANRLYLGIRPKVGKRNILTNTDTLSTQNAETSAVEYTLSFKGTGTVTLTGTSTAGPLVGTGASDIVELTFTPTAGTLTLTVSGTVEEAQLEKGASRTTYQKVTEWYITTEGTPTTDNHVYSLVGIAGDSLYMTIPGSASALKFLHDGTGAYVVGAWQAGNVPNPDTSHPLFGSNSGTTSQRGVLLSHDDRSFVPRSNAFVGFISKASAVASVVAEDAITPNTPNIISTSYAEGLSPEYVGKVNGASIGSSAGDAPSSGNSTRDLHIFQSGGNTFYATALLDSLIITDYVPSAAAQTQVVNFLKADSGI